MRTALVYPMTFLSCVVALAAHGDALACGGCFHEEAAPSPSVVTGHRMAFAISAERSILWDQIQYSGSPRDFAWVLPVAPGAYVESSTDAWFEALEAFSTTEVMPPPLNCASASRPTGGGCGCMGADEGTPAAEHGGFVDPTEVTVVHAGTVGPYETVTLESKNPQALVTWLRGHHYAIPPSVVSIIEAYVGEGSDFIALRLSPDADVQQMTPVRVVTPSGKPILPLRMVAAGVASSVPITLYVVAEQRYLMTDLAEQSVRFQDLTWDWPSSSSNYLTLRAGALAQNLGKAYLTTFAARGAFYEQIIRPDGVVARFAPTGAPSGNTPLYQTPDNLTDLYYVQAAINDKLNVPSCPLVSSSITSDTLVADCPAAAAGRDGDAATDADAASDAMAEGGAATACSTSVETTLNPSALQCGPWSDVAAALTGMHPDRVWITRLEMNLPLDALGADCRLEPHVQQEPVANWHVAEIHKSPPCNPIGGAKVVGVQPPMHRGRRSNAAGAVAASVFGLLLLRKAGRRGPTTKRR
jgi:hypothetical protein